MSSGKSPKTPFVTPNKTPNKTPYKSPMKTPVKTPYNGKDSSEMVRSGSITKKKNNMNPRSARKSLLDAFESMAIGNAPSIFSKPGPSNPAPSTTKRSIDDTDGGGGDVMMVEQPSSRVRSQVVGDPVKKHRKSEEWSLLAELEQLRTSVIDMYGMVKNGVRVSREVACKTALRMMSLNDELYYVRDERKDGGDSVDLKEDLLVGEYERMVDEVIQWCTKQRDEQANMN